MSMSEFYIESRLDNPEEVPLCSLCDQPIFESESVVIGIAFGCKCLIHFSCAMEDENE